MNYSPRGLCLADELVPEMTVELICETVAKHYDLLDGFPKTKEFHNVRAD